MGKKWNPEEVSVAGSLLPDKMYTVVVKEAEESETRNGKYSIAIRTRVVAPAKFKNRPFNFQFVIGTDSDLEADEMETWQGSFAASRYKSFLVAAGVPETGDVEEELEAAAGQRLVIDAGHHKDEESGRTYQDANGFYAEGEQDDSEEDAPAPAKKAAKPVDADDDADEEDEEEEAPPARKPAAKGKVAAKGKSKKAADDEDEDDWD